MTELTGTGDDSGHESKPVDVSALAKLVGEDPILHRRLMQKYVDTSPEIIETLRAAIAAGNLADIAAAAHKLKSSSRAIGADTLADLCQELELAGKAESVEGSELLVAAVIPEFERVVAYIGMKFGAHV